MKNIAAKEVIELIGAVAVLIGLVFVGLELRQNTAAMEAATLQNQSDASTDFLLLVASDAELSRIWQDSTDDPGKMSELDALRFFLVSRARWIRMQNAYFQWSRGTLNDDGWSFYEGLICKPGTAGPMQFVRGWEDHRVALAPNFVAFVESCWVELKQSK